MQRWTCRQLDRLRDPGRPVQGSFDLHDEPSSGSRWDAALARARTEIRALIETGDIDHDDITENWVAQWATDLLAA